MRTNSHNRSGSASMATGERYQLTSGKKSSNSPHWSPDSRRLAFVSDRAGKRQIYLIAPTGGEAVQLTTEENGIGSMAWSPDGSAIAFTSSGPESKIQEGPQGKIRRLRNRRRRLHHEPPLAGENPGRGARRS